MTTEIEVDINTRFLPDDHRVYLLFPGEGYRYYSYMHQENVVFLDIPGFPLPETDVFSQDKNLVKRLVISDRVREWHRHGGPEDDLPPRKVDDVNSYRRTRHRLQFASTIGRFFSTLRRGDVVVVPPQSDEDDVLFGELLDEPNSRVFVKSPDYVGEMIPCRRVRWYAKKKRHDVPLWLLRKIPSPNPLRQFEKSQQHYVYDLMYERYYFNGEFACKLSVSSTDFSTFDNFLIQQLILYPAALHEGLTAEATEINPEDPIALAISKIKFSNSIPDQRIQISSPGFIVVYAKNIIPIVTGVLISAAAITPLDAGQKNLGNIKIVNTADNSEASKKCQGDVAAEVAGDLNAAGYARWRELCLIEMEVRKRTDLSTGMPATTGSIRRLPRH